MKERQIMMKKRKFPYEDPKFLKIEVLNDIITESDDYAETEAETEDDGWDMGFLPF